MGHAVGWTRVVARATLSGELGGERDRRATPGRRDLNTVSTPPSGPARRVSGSLRQVAVLTPYRSATHGRGLLATGSPDRAFSIPLAPTSSELEPRFSAFRRQTVARPLRLPTTERQDCRRGGSSGGLSAGIFAESREIVGIGWKNCRLRVIQARAIL